MRLLSSLLALLSLLFFPALVWGGGSWSCDGTSTGYAEFDHDSAYNSATFTIAMWFRAGTAGSVFPVLMSRNNEAASVHFNWMARISNGEQGQPWWNYNKTGNSSTYDTYGLTLVDGQWYRYWYRLLDNGSTRQINHRFAGRNAELGDALAQDNPSDFTNAPIQLCRASLTGSYAYDFDGRLAHVEVFNTDLDDGALLFNLWHPGRMTANQVMYLPLTGATIDDISSTNNDPSTTGAGMSAEDGGPPLGWAGGLGY